MSGQKRWLKNLKKDIGKIEETERDDKFYETYFDWKGYTLVIINFCFNF